MEVKYYAYDYNLCSSNILFKSCKIDEDIKTLGVVEVKHQAYMIYDNKIIYDECSTGFQTFILNPRLLVQYYWFKSSGGAQSFLVTPALQGCIA